MATIVNVLQDLYDWDGTGDLYLNADLEINTSNYTRGEYFPLTMQDGAKVYGNLHTITFNDIGLFDGLFKPAINATISIRSLMMVRTGSGQTGGDGGYLIGSTYNQNISGWTCDVTNVGGKNIQVASGFVGGIAGKCHYTSTLNLTGCYVQGTSVSGGGGGLVGHLHNGTITNCFTNFNAIAGGGLVGRASGTIVLNKVYVVGEVGGTGGQSGYFVTVQSGCNLTVTNCAHFGNLNPDLNLCAALVYNLSSGATVNISNFWAKDTSVIFNATDDALTDGKEIFNFLDGAEATTAQWEAVVTYDSATVGNTATVTSVSTALLDNTFANTTDDNWTYNGTDYRLTYFLDNGEWNDSTYTSATDSALLGDPHIKPMEGEEYDLDYLGYVKCFDNHNNNRLIVNGFIGNGDNRDHKKTYFKKIFVKHNENYMIINTGFRGRFCEVELCKGMSFAQKELQLDRNVRRKCKNIRCRYTTFNKSDHSHDQKGHYVLRAVRNTIILTIDADIKYEIHIQNVDKKNQHPANVKINLEHKDNISNYTGCLVRNTELNKIKLNNIFETNEN